MPIFFSIAPESSAFANWICSYALRVSSVSRKPASAAESLSSELCTTPCFAFVTAVSNSPRAPAALPLL